MEMDNTQKILKNPIHRKSSEANHVFCFLCQFTRGYCNIQSSKLAQGMTEVLTTPGFLFLYAIHVEARLQRKRPILAQNLSWHQLSLGRFIHTVVTTRRSATTTDNRRQPQTAANHHRHSQTTKVVHQGRPGLKISVFLKKVAKHSMLRRTILLQRAIFHLKGWN